MLNLELSGILEDFSDIYTMHLQADSFPQIYRREKKKCKCLEMIRSEEGYLDNYFYFYSITEGTLMQ